MKSRHLAARRSTPSRTLRQDGTHATDATVRGRCERRMTHRGECLHLTPKANESRSGAVIPCRLPGLSTPSRQRFYVLLAAGRESIRVDDTRRGTMSSWCADVTQSAAAVQGASTRDAARALSSPQGQLCALPVPLAMRSFGDRALAAPLVGPRLGPATLNAA
jgi:hypothetical protein